MQVSESKFVKLAKAVDTQAEVSSLAVHVKRVAVALVLILGLSLTR
jgi:hypothetical protein